MSFAYREQIRTNGKEGPVYLSYLRQIANERRSEMLETLVATEYSAGNFDSEQLNEAYRYFALSPRDDAITDDLILGTFQARLQDAPKHEADMRAHLKVIGVHRNSQRIKDVAEDGKLQLELSCRVSSLMFQQHSILMSKRWHFSMQSPRLLTNSFRRSTQPRLVLSRDRLPVLPLAVVERTSWERADCQLFRQVKIRQ